MTLAQDGGVTPGAIVRLALAAMGTRFELVLLGDDEARLRAAGEAALDEVAWWHRRLSRFERDSDVSFIAREAHLRDPSNPLTLDPDLFDLLLRCERARGETRGAFDVRLGGAMDAWIGGGRPAPPSEIPEMVLDPVGRTLGVRSGAALRLDLGGVAKGFALDGAAATLVESGVRNALLHAGTSSVIAIGDGPAGGGWKVRIDGRDGGVPFDVCLRSRAMSISSSAGRTAEGGGGHILDPREGRSVPLGTTVAILADHGPGAAVECEIWSTALAVDPRLLDDVPSTMTTIVRRAAAHEWSVRHPRVARKQSTTDAADLAAMEIS